MIGDHYKNLKTGTVYVINDTCINCNNNRVHDTTVTYFKREDPNTLYSRDLPEFLVKFEKVNDAD
jgi:hypothetical protein